MRLGTRYELTEILNLYLKFDIAHQEFNTKQQRNNIGLQTVITYNLGPRTTLGFDYTDRQIPSFAANKLAFRSIKTAGSISYQVSPLIDLSLALGFQKQRSGSKDAASGSTVGNEKTKSFDIKTGFRWQLNERAYMTMGHRYARGKSNDFTIHQAVIGFETEL